jgi:hypothetical protein
MVCTEPIVTGLIVSTRPAEAQATPTLMNPSGHTLRSLSAFCFTSSSRWATTAARMAGYPVM